jgi:hypothetical protein
MIEIKDREDGGATAHVDGKKHSVLVGGAAAALRRVIRETAAGEHDHPVRVRLIRTDGYCQWPSIIAATSGLDAERTRPPVPSITTWAR